MHSTISPHRPDAQPPSRERGAALIIALFVLTALAFIAMFVASSSTVNRKMSSDDVTKIKALRYAEAGVCEAMARIQAGLGPDPTIANAPRKVVQILNANSAAAAGTDTTTMATGQPAGQWLAYSTPSSGAGALTIAFRTDAGRTVLYKYDKTQNPPVQTSSGTPIYRITSTGKVGGVSRTLVAEVTWSPVTITLDIKGGLTCAQDVKFNGNAVACGFDHRVSTPVGTGASGRAGGGGCAENLAAVPPRWELSTGSIPGIWSTSTINFGGNSAAYGTPATSVSNPGFYAGPWEILGMTKAQFYAWAGNPSSSMPGSPSGVTYLDNDGTRQNSSGSWSTPNGTGLLYADGDLTLQSNWRGLIYCEGNLKFNATGWVLGAVVSRGSSQLQMNGGATLLYSYDSILQFVTGGVGGGAKPTLLSWQEQ